MNESIIENRKYYKRNKLLNLIRNRDTCSRFELKKLTSYSMATVLTLTEELIEGGFIYEEESSDARVGRKPQWLRINPRYGGFVGIEFNATRMNCVLLDFCANIAFQASDQIAPEDGPEQVLGKIAALIERARSHRPGVRVFGVGVGVPGYYDAEAGMAFEYPYIQGWKDVPIRAELEGRFDMPCYLENNVTAMAIGYKHLHMPQESSDDFLFTSVRNGVRVVPAIGNEMFLSNKGYAGQLGHTKVPGSNRLCSCGKRGCLNAEVSNIGLKTKIIEAVLAGRMQPFFDMVGRDFGRISVRELVASALLGHQDSVQMIRDSAEYLGGSLGVMLDILAPKHVVIYGELVKAGDLFMQPLQQAMANNAIADNVAHLRLSQISDDESIGAVGAAMLVMNKQFEFLKETV